MRNILRYKTIHLSLLFVIISTSVNAQVMPFGFFNSSTSTLPSLRDNTTLVVEMTSQTGKIWMDRNLGASQVATSSTDVNAFGDLYQWGRATDGHQVRTSTTTSTLSSSDSPGNGNFILAANSPYDWRSPQKNTLWQGINGINNPCPDGYRIPTSAEWDAETAAWTGGNNSAGAFSSSLKLPAAGGRRYTNGVTFDANTIGYYWTSTATSIASDHLWFDSTTLTRYNNGRGYGFSVRCIKNN